MTCNTGCYNKMMDQLKGPVDNNSLASQRIYESQTAARRCITSNNGCASCSETDNNNNDVMDRPHGGPYFSRSQPLSRYRSVGGAIEGFDGCIPDMKTLLKWIIIGLVVYLVLSLITDAQRTPVVMPIAVLQQTGGAMNISEFDIMNSLFDK